MASRIKGITIELDGETRGLDKALSDVNKKSRDLQKELRDVDRLLKFNPGNTELIAQKQKLLGDEVENTREKLKRLKDAQADVQAQFEKGDISEEAYRNFQREIVETESKLKHFEGQLQTSKSKLEEFGEGMEKAGNKMKDVGKNITDVGKDLSMKVTAPILGAGAIAFKYASDLEDAFGATDQIFKNSSDEVKNWADNLDSSYGVAEGEALEYANTMGAMLQNIGGLSEKEAAKQSQILVELAGDLTAMFGGTTESAIQALTGALKGNNSMLDNYGMGVNEATIKTKAFEMGLMDAGSSAEELTKANLNIEKAQNKYNDAVKKYGSTSLEARTAENNLAIAKQKLTDASEKVTGTLSLEAKQQATLALIMEQTTDAQGQAAREAEGASGSMRALVTELKNLAGEFGENLLPIITPFIAKLKDMVQSFRNLSPAAQITITVIAALAAAIGPVLIVIGMLISSIGSIMTVVGPVITAIGEMGGVMALLTNPITLVIAAVAALIAIFVVLYKNNEAFRDKVNEIWTSIQEFFQTALAFISDVVSTVMSDIVSFFSEQLGKIRDFWQENGEGIMTIVTTYFNLVWTTIKFVLNQIKSVFQIVWPIIYGVVKIAFEYIKMFVSNGIDLVLGIIQTVMKILQGDWKGAWETIKDTAKSIMDNIIKFFENIDLWQIGKDIIQGLIDGIKSMVDNVKKTISSIAENIPEWTKKILGIASPSKVFAQIGEWTGEGLVDGMDSTARQIRNASERMAQMSIPNVPKSESIGFGVNGGASTGGSLNLEGLFKGAVFNVREEQDIEKIAKALNDYIKIGARKGGVIIT